MIKIPELSFGASAIAGLYQPVSLEQASAVLDTAWEGDIRFFDVAPHYGQGLAERRLGDFLRQKKSADFILSTKVGRLLTPSVQVHGEMNGFKKPLPFDQHFDFTYDGIMRSVEDSYQRLGLNKIDILFVHDLGDVKAGADAPEYFDQFLKSGHKALAKLKDDGSIKAVGLGANYTEVCERLIGRVHMDLILLAGRYTLLEQSKAQKMMTQCRQHNIKLIIGGVFNSGILATGPIEGAKYDYEPAPPEILNATAEIKQICSEYEIPLAAVAMAFPRRHEIVASTIIGTAKVSSLTRNLEQWNMKIPEALWDNLKSKGFIAPNSQ